MNKLYVLLLFLLLGVWNNHAQTTTETFETTGYGATTFSSNGQQFVISTQSNGSFSIGVYGNNSNKSITNDNDYMMLSPPSEFTIATNNSALFTLKSIYITGDDGVYTIRGKRAGNVVFTVTATISNYVYKLIDMAISGGQNNANTIIDSYTISTPNAFFVYMDDMTWQKADINSSVAALSSFTTCGGTVSAAQNFTVSGASLTAGIVVTAPNGYEVSTTSGTGYATSVTLPQTTGSVAATTIYARLTATASGTPSGNIALTSTGKTTVNVAVNGTVSTIVDPTNKIVCLGGGTTFSVSATGSMAYQWQVDTNASGNFTNISNGAFYSGVTSNTLAITGATANMSGYRYRAVATGSCTMNSNYATLTVTSITIAGTITDVSCFEGANGAVSVLPSGGVPSYTYSWNTNPVQHTSILTGLTAGTYTVTVTDANGCTGTQSFVIGQPAPLAATTTQNNVSCNGGSNATATVTVSGGTGTYTYAWSPSGGTAATASGLTSGAYSVTATDANGCTITKNVTISQPAPLAATTSQNNVSCNGGSNATATVTVTGGTGLYTYAWSPSGGTAATASGLTSGAYSVTATDANGCTIIKNVTISQPAPLTATTTQNNVSCNGGSNASATVTVTGGTGTYTYEWSPSGGTAATASGLTSGAYSVTATDANGCAIIKNVTISQPAPLTATTTQNNVSCNGGSNATASITVTGGTGTYTYAWSPSGGTAATASGLTSGAYSVTATDANGCTITKNVTISQPVPLAATTSQNNVSCNGGSNGSATVTVTGGTGTYTYSWSPSGGTAATASGLTSGAYSVTATDANGCTITKNFTISQPAPLTATTTQNNVSCNGGSNGSATVTVTGGTGLYTYAWSPSGGTAATASGLTSGAYSVTAMDENGCTITKNVTISQPAPLTATTTQNNVSCNGGSNASATVTVTGGTGTYTYAWSPSGGTAATASGLTSGTYSVTATDANGCTITKNVTISQPAPLAATTSQNNVSCNGGSNATASITVTGGTGIYTYAWFPSGGTAATASGLISGAYSVTATDANGCTIIRNFTISQPAPLAATTTQNNVSCNGGSNATASITVSGGTGAYTYSWSPSGGTAATASGLTSGAYSVTATDENGCTITKNVTISQPVLLAATTSQNNVSCNGGSNATASITVSGGTGIYTYAWSPSGGTAATASGLTSGAYSVTATDANGCTITKNVTISQPVPLAATTSQNNVSCNGGSNGSVTVTVTGGTGVYTYTWSPSGGTAATASGLTSGTYSVTATDANGCTITKNVTISQPAPLAATTSQNNVSCNGGSNATASITVSGGTGAYTYSWSPSGGTAATASGLTSGAYSVTATDENGCTITKNVTISQPAPLTATTTQNNVSCNGGSNGSATVTVTGGTGIYTYAWSPSGGTAATASGLTYGAYSVTATDANGCTIIRNFTISQPAPLAATTTQNNVSCNGGSNATASITVTGGTGIYTYAWSPSGGTAATATGLSAGVYTVLITDGNGCTQTQSFTITQPTAITTSGSQINVSCNGGSNASATVTATGGTGTYTYEWSPSGGTAATATGLSAGAYTVTVTDGNGCTQMQSFTITAPTALTAIASHTDGTCNGSANGSAAVMLSGGTAPYSYVWSPSGGTAATASNLTAGTYTVTIADANGCTISETITIAEPLAIAINTQPAGVTTTTGNNAQFVTQAINASSYQWEVSTNGVNWTSITDGGTAPAYSGATTNTLGMTNIPVAFNGYFFRVQLINGMGCTTSSGAAILTVVNVLQAVNDDFTAVQLHEGMGGIAGNVIANDLLNNLPVNNNAVTITVVDNDGLTGVNIDAEGNLHVPVTAAVGTYTITYQICDILSGGNCDTAEAIVVIAPVAGTKDFEPIQFVVYPNPASTVVNVKLSDFASYNNLKATIYDLTGRMVRAHKVSTAQFSVDVAGLESAVYILSITSDTGKATKNIVVTKKP